MVRKILYPLVLLSLLVGLGLPFAQPVYATTATLSPDGEGSYTGGSYTGGATFAVLDSDNGDTSYWGSGTSFGGYRTWTWTNPGLPAGSTINSITVYAKARHEGFARQFCILYYDGLSLYQGSFENLTWPDYTLYSKTWSTNPGTGLAWTETQIDDAQFGITATSINRYTYIYVVVDYTAPTVPAVTTNVTLPVACVTATLNGEITDTGGENADMRGFVWDTSSHGVPPGAPPAPYSDNWTEAGSFGVATFTHDLTPLTEGQTYYARAFAHNSLGWTYGSEVTFTCWHDPTVTTVAATDITVSSARLQAYLVDGGETTCQVRFGWGSVDEGTDIDAYNGVGSPSAFAGAYTIGQSPYLDVDNLVSDNTTYFNVQAQNVCGSDNGTSTSFPTGSGVGSPSNVTAIPGYDNVVLSWTKGAGAPNTWVRFRANACPADETDGALIYVATGSTYTHIGLTSGIDYCYLLIGYDPVLLYSDNYTIIHATTLAAGSTVGAAGTAISNPSSMTQTPSVSATLEDNIPIFPFIRGGSTSTGIPMGNFVYGGLLIILTGLSYAIYKWNHSIEAIVMVWVFANWVAYPTLHIPVIVPVFVSLVGIGYGIYKMRSIV
jgi:hypothetical protein